MCNSSHNTTVRNFSFIFNCYYSHSVSNKFPVKASILCHLICSIQMYRYVDGRIDKPSNIVTLIHPVYMRIAYDIIHINICVIYQKPKSLVVWVGET